MWVAIRSRNQRSCEITIAQPGNSSRAFSSARRVSISGRWLVHRAAGRYRRPAAVSPCRRPRSPPDSSPTRLPVDAFEVKAAHVGAARHLGVADLHDIRAARHFFPHGLTVVHRVAELIDGSQLNGFTGDGAGIRLFWPDIMRKRVDLPAPFGPMMPTIAPFGTEKLRSSIRTRSP